MGNAMIIDCYGRIVAETWKAQDALVVADLDLDLLPLATGRRWIRGRRRDPGVDPLVASDGLSLDDPQDRVSAAA
ncbi:hypothetical protein J4G37_61885, partial [Microvirga sp. 3-52]|nr:hypothetical protein [Microvirga sp. 3-52]